MLLYPCLKFYISRVTCVAAAHFNHNMSKRTADSDDDKNPHPKRQKKTKITTVSAPATEKHEIRSPRDLQLLLAFDQDAGPVVRQSKIH